MKQVFQMDAMPVTQPTTLKDKLQQL